MNTAKKVISILLALALVCALAATAVSAQSGTKLVVLGDSIAAGEGASEPAKRYADLIAAEKGFDLANFAVGGHDSDDLLALLDENGDAVQAIKDADIINLSIGGNDLLHTNVITLVLRVLLGEEDAADEHIESFAENFAVIVERIRALNPDALFVVQTLYNSMEGVPLVAGAYEVVVVRLNRVYRDYLDANPGAYALADVYDAFKAEDRGGRGHVFPDKVHPSDAGHALIARVVTAAIDDTEPGLEPVPGPDPGFVRQIFIFLRAVVDYLGYWLTIYTPLELLRQALSFI